MMKVPSYDRQVNEITPSGGFLNIRAKGENFGSDFGEMAQKVGGSIQNVAETVDRADIKLQTARARDTYTKASAALQDYVQSAKMKKSGDAIGAYKDAITQFSKMKDAYRKELGDKRAQDIFDASFDDDINRGLISVKGHELEQHKVYDDNTKDAENLLAINKASTNPNDEQVKESLETIRLNTMSKYKGEGPKVSFLKTQQAQDALHLEVVKRVNEASPVKAQEYLMRQKEHGRISETAYADLMARTKAGALEYRSAAMADDIFARNADNMESAYKEIGDIKDIELRKKTRDAYQDTIRAQKEVRAEKDRQMKEIETDKLYANPGTYVVPVDASADIQNYLYDLKSKMNKSPDVSDAATLMELRSKSPNELKGVNLSEYAGRLSRADFKTFSDIQFGKGKADFVEPSKQIMNFVNSTEAFDKKKNDASGENRNYFLTQINRTLQDIPVQEQTPERINDLINYWNAPTTDRSGTFNRVRPRWEAYRNAENRGDAQKVLDSIPKDAPTDAKLDPVKKVLFRQVSTDTYSILESRPPYREIKRIRVNGRQ